MCSCYCVYNNVRKTCSIPEMEFLAHYIFLKQWVGSCYDVLSASCLFCLLSQSQVPQGRSLQPVTPSLLLLPPPPLPPFPPPPPHSPNTRPRNLTRGRSEVTKKPPGATRRPREVTKTRPLEPQPTQRPLEDRRRPLGATGRPRGATRRQRGMTEGEGGGREGPKPREGRSTAGGRRRQRGSGLWWQLREPPTNRSGGNPAISTVRGPVCAL